MLKRERRQELQAVLRSFFSLCLYGNQNLFAFSSYCRFQKNSTTFMFSFNFLLLLQQKSPFCKILKKKKSTSGAMRASCTEQWGSCALATDPLLPKLFLIQSFTWSATTRENSTERERKHSKWQLNNPLLLHNSWDFAKLKQKAS